MPPRSLSDAELQRLGSWPEEIARSDVVAFFTVDVDDLRWVHTSRSSANRLGLGVQLCALRFLGFIPEDLDATPGDVVARLVEQIAATVDDLGRYSAATSERVRREHAAAVVRRAGWSMCGRGEWKRLADWLTDRALEHDTPGVLFHQALDHLRYQQIVRPGLDRLMRAVGSARVRADTAIYRRVSPLLTVELCERLDVLITTDPQLRVAPLVWLNSGATTTSAEAIKTEIAKLDHLRAIGADGLGLGAIPPERRRQLAAVARRSSPKALREMAPERRYPMLLAAIADIHGRVVDEIVQLFDQALAATDSRARNQVADHIQALARADVERLVLLEQIIGVIRDDDLDDATVGARLRGLGRERLAAAARREDEPLPRDGGHLQLLEARYNYFRSFAPHVLAALSFEASTTPSDTLTAVNVLREMNRDGRRHVPADAPDGFVPARWQPYLTTARAAGNATAYRHYWEVCVLFALRDALRSGEIWVHGSRRYTNPASYLIDPAAWPSQRDDVLDLIGRPATFAERLDQLDTDLHVHLDDLEALLAVGDAPIRLDPNGELHLTPLAAEALDPAIIAERDQITDRLPTVPLAEILIEIDEETGFSTHLTHAAGATPRASTMEHRRNLYAAILAQACNFGIVRMAELTGISVDTLSWYTRWYLREETLRAANTPVIDTHRRHQLAQAWGGGTLSSSDGLRLPMQGRSLTARHLSRYFVDEGITTYTHVSDQHSTYGTQIIVSTERDATYTLDEILGNTTELAIAEHTTNTHGQTLATFALFDLVGLRLSPRASPNSPRNASGDRTRPGTTNAGRMPDRCSPITPRSTASPSTGTTCCASPTASNSATSRPRC